MCQNTKKRHHTEKLDVTSNSSKAPKLNIQDQSQAEPILITLSYYYYSNFFIEF